MSTLLDRLLEVAKDFEAERLQDQLQAQRAHRQLEQDLKALKRTAMYRADEISFLENQLQDARTEVETANDALKEAQEQNTKEASTTETDMKREIVCLRLEIGRLRTINSKLSIHLDNRKNTSESDEKENSLTPNSDISTTASEISTSTSTSTQQKLRHLTSAQIEAAEPPIILARESIDIQDTASDLYRAAKNGDINTMEELLSPVCVCLDSYEQLITRALSSVCAATTVTKKPLKHKRSKPKKSILSDEFVHVRSSGEQDDLENVLENENENEMEEELDSESELEEQEEINNDATSNEVTSELRMQVAKLLIQEGAVTTTASNSASGSGGNAVKQTKSVLPAPLHMASWSGDAALVELLLAQPNAPLNISCEGYASNKTIIKGTPLELAVQNISRGTPPSVAKALLMAGANPDLINGPETEEKCTMNKLMKITFNDCAVMFWNSSVRAFEAYSSSNYNEALDIWGSALSFITKGKLTISGPDKARLHYNRARALCHLRRRVDALAELDFALELAPDYSNARVLQAESYFELYAFDKCLSAITSIPKEMCDTNEKIKTMKGKALQQKNMTHYHVLGLVGPPSSESEIKKAYRKQSMKWHPDKHQQNKDSTRRATTTFKRLNEANQILGDTYAKMMYDAEIESKMARNNYGHSSGSGSGSSSFGGYNSGSSRRKSYKDEDTSTKQTAQQRARAEYNAAGGSSQSQYRRASAPPSSSNTTRDMDSNKNNTNGGDVGGSYYRQSNYADGQRRREHDEDDVMSDTDEEDEDVDDDMMNNVDAWRKADVLDSMEFDHEDLMHGYAYGGYDD